jgi:lysyl-tRNA synthetase class 2
MKRSEQELVRFEKLAEIRAQRDPYPNDVKVDCSSIDLAAADVQEPAQAKRFSWAGRIVQMRHMGKAAFVHILDRYGKFQIYVRKDDIGEDSYAEFKHLDIGDLIETKGYVFITKTGEKTLHSESIRLIAKSLIPLPEKWHGLTDVESRYRYRHVDLISNHEVREIFLKRALIIKEIRAFLDERDYLEVETPVLQPIAGGTTARPFATHYNALSSDVFLRIALELPLKKLIVGGFERVYEIGRVFRNEGLSKRHNPEFTMLEFYQAYATFEDLMTLSEELFVRLVKKINSDSLLLGEGDAQIDFTTPWPRLSMLESIYKIGGVPSDRYDLSKLEDLVRAAKDFSVDLAEPTDWGRSLEALFDHLAQPKLKNPTFITHHPLAISPLAFKNRANPEVTDRFELFMAGMEVSNAFSELNDPIDQRERFESQAERKAAGDDEAQEVDEDFLRALEYGMPPTAGQGIGIDRLVMILTGSPNLREVLLFPQLKQLEESIDE